jgi:hypothetical protein
MEPKRLPTRSLVEYDLTWDKKYFAQLWQNKKCCTFIKIEWRNIRLMKRRKSDFKNMYRLNARNIIFHIIFLYSVMKRFVRKRCVILALCSEHNTTFFPSAHGVPDSRDFTLWGGGGQWGGLLFISLRYVLYSDIDVTPLPLGLGFSLVLFLALAVWGVPTIYVYCIWIHSFAHSIFCVNM